MGGCVNGGSKRYKTEASEKLLDGHELDSHPTGKERKLIKDTLQACCMCTTCTSAELDELSDAAQVIEFLENSTVCKRGEPGTHFFVVSSGEFEEEIGGSSSSLKIRALSRGSSFGEFALLPDCVQRNTVSCKKAGKMWGVPGETFRRILEQLSLRQREENLYTVSQASLFKPLSISHREMLVNSAHTHVYAKGAYVLREGESENCVYVIRTGDVKVLRKGKEIRRLTNGDIFGERAMLYKEPRSATILALTPVTCLCIGSRQLQEVLRKDGLNDLLYNNIIKMSLCEDKLLKQLMERQVEGLVQATEQNVWDAGVCLYDPSCADQSWPYQSCPLEKVRCFVVLEGEVEISHSDDLLPGPTSHRLERGGFFGEGYLSDPGCPIMHTIRSTQKVKLAYLTSEAILRVLGTLNIPDVVLHNEKMNTLKNVYFFQILSAGQMEQLVRAFRILPPMASELTVVREGEAGDTFYLIADGEVQVTIGDRFIRKMTRNTYFGERALLFNERRTATVTVSQDATVLWAVDKQVFLPIISEIMRQHLEYRTQLQDTSVAFQDLQESRVLGKGAFGVVKMVIHKKTQTRYAMKCVKKKRIVELDQSINVQKEREILAESDHPFVIKLVRTFKDSKYVYFLFELLTGGELYQVIRKLGILDHANAQFYFGCLLLSIEYLHSRSVTFRDLKPENVLLTSKGYPKLIDFGCARKCDDGRAFTLIGTPHYMAPEVILGKGYRLSADVWSLGICLYEFVCGPLPFGNHTDDKLEIFKDILLGKLSFLPDFKDNSACSLIEQLLNRSPAARIGCSIRGLGDVKQHPFYDGFEWDKLLSMDLQPPYMPEEELYAFDTAKETWEDDDAQSVEGTDAWDSTF